MVKETLFGPMEEDIKGSISGIKKKDMENLHGKMVEYTAANGRMESKTGREFIATRRVLRDLEYGQMERR